VATKIGSEELKRIDAIVSPSRSAESERLCEGGDMVVSQPVKP